VTNWPSIQTIRCLDRGHGIIAQFNLTGGYQVAPYRIEPDAGAAVSLSEKTLLVNQRILVT
jgi:hypothetical protein